MLVALAGYLDGLFFEKRKEERKKERVVVELDVAIPFQLGSLIGRNTFELFNARVFGLDAVQR